MNLSALVVASCSVMSTPSGNVVVRDRIVPFGPEGVDSPRRNPRPHDCEQIWPDLSTQPKEAV